MTRIVPLSQNQFALVDDEDYESVAGHKWYYLRAPHTGYAQRVRRPMDGPGPQRIAMHRFIMNPPPGMCVDHINMNGLDNRRCNLRICTKTENGRNRGLGRANRTSQYKGVGWQRKDQKWEAQIVVGRDQNGKRIKCYLGLFADERDAALAYDAAARQYHGEFAWTNFGRDADL